VLNRRASQQPAGNLRLRGQINEPAAATINGKPVTVSSDLSFDTTVPATSGTNTLTISATDGSGNQATNVYEVDSSGSSKTFTYDANGNLTSDGARTFEWDARNQLVAVTVGTHRAEFSYDGKQRRVRTVEKENSVIQSDTKVIWCQAAICEDRAGDGVDVTRRLFADGEEVEGVTRFFTRDHLGSVREVTNASGTVLGRFDFDPWGRRTLAAGVDLTRVAFTGHEVNTATGLELALYRAYDPELGDWLSEDPLGVTGGLNLYSYVNREPIGHADPTGLVAVAITDPSIAYLHKSQIGGCGKTEARVDLDGKCHCEDGGWKANLSITLSGAIKIADDTLLTPKWAIRAHERYLHWMAYVGAVQAAKAAGEGIEATVFPSKRACEAAVSAWKAEWLQRIKDAGAHNTLQNFGWGLICE